MAARALWLCMKFERILYFYKVRMDLRICGFFAVIHGVCTLNYPRGHTFNQ